MFDPQKLLGQLLSGGMKSKKRKSRSSSLLGGITGSMGGSMKGAAAMGILGVGIAAFEHFMKNRTDSAPASAPLPQPLAPNAAPPPPPPAAAAADNDAVLRLIRSMIAAAHADGVIDATERSNIMGRLGEAGLSADEQLFLIREMDAPWSIAQLSAGVNDATFASQLYAAALLAIDADTAAEQAHLQQLAAALRLSEQDVQTLHQQIA